MLASWWRPVPLMDLPSEAQPFVDGRLTFVGKDPRNARCTVTRLGRA